MAVEIYMNGMLEPVTVEETFTDILNALNKGAGMGQAYTHILDMKGQNVAFHHDNVQILREVADEAEDFMAAT